MLCKFCEKLCKNDNSLRNHQRLCHKNPDRQEHPRGRLGKPTSAETKKKQSEYYTKERRESHAEKTREWAKKHPRKHTQETKTKLSILACNRLKNNSKYSKNIEYKGVILESSYELLFAKQLDMFGVKWEKCRGIRFEYSDTVGKIRGYIPDFYLEEFDVYIDTKNDYLIVKDSHKISSVIERNKIQLLVYSLDDIVSEKILLDFPTIAHGEQVAL